VNVPHFAGGVLWVNREMYLSLPKSWYTFVDLRLANSTETLGALSAREDFHPVLP
jgi:hypothetical protein